MPCDDVLGPVSSALIQKVGLAYVARTKQTAHIDDIRTRQPYLEGDKAVVGLADLSWRSHTSSCSDA